MDNEQIVNSIKNLCKNSTTSITKLEESLGLSQGLISRWTKTEPSLSKIIAIADYFNTTVDDVIGRSNVKNDKFLNKLISQTVNKEIRWNSYDINETEPKRYVEPIEMNFISQTDADEYFSVNKDLSYYTKVNNGYISIYGAYNYNNIEKPTEIKLFIQPDDNANLVEQDYSLEQLLSLWLKVIYSLDEEAPDEIKAEELKNNFIQDGEKHSFINYKFNISTQQNLDQLNKLKKIFSDPDFQAAIKAANMIQNSLKQKED